MYGEDYTNDGEFEWNIEYRFGPSVEHVSNFDASEEKKLLKLIVDNKLAVFVDKAYIGNGETSDPSMVGVYSTLPHHIEKFWAVYDESKNNSHI